MPKSRGTRLAIREARLITAELRRLGVPPKVIAKLWGAVIAIPLVLIFGYFAFNYDSGTADPSILSAVRITPQDSYKFHIRNNTGITLKSLTVRCSPGGDAQPTTFTTRMSPPLEPGYGQDVYMNGDCHLIRVNESHQLW